MGGVDDQTHDGPPTVHVPSTSPERELMPVSTRIPYDALYVIEDLKEKKQELRDRISKLEAKNEALLVEKTDLEKQLDKVSSELSAKPGALAGFFSNPENVVSFADKVPAILEGIQKLIQQRNAGAPATQLEGTQEQEPLAIWLNSKPADIQKLFVNMVNNLMKYGKEVELRATLNQILTQTLRATG